MKTNKYKVSIAVTGSKGGVGKSTIAALLSQWFINKGLKVNVSDVDNASSSISRWIKSCEKLGIKENFHNPEAEINIIDTGGRIGSSLIKDALSADLIVLPFRPRIADIREVGIWFLECSKNIQDKIVFVPNFKRNSQMHKKNIYQIGKVIEKADFSSDELPKKLLSGLSDRYITYAVTLDGSKNNFLAH